jgi:hypothetical protein
MHVSAALALAGGVLAWFTISSDVLHREPSEPEPTNDYSCAVCGAPLVSGHPSHAPEPAA